MIVEALGRRPILLFGHLQELAAEVQKGGSGRHMSRAWIARNYCREFVDRIGSCFFYNESMNYVFLLSARKYRLEAATYTAGLLRR